MASQSSETIHTLEKLEGNVLVVGAGPVGLAISLKLALQVSWSTWQRRSRG